LCSVAHHFRILDCEPHPPTYPLVIESRHIPAFGLVIRSEAYSTPPFHAANPETHQVSLLAMIYAYASHKAPTSTPNIPFQRPSSACRSRERAVTQMCRLHSLLQHRIVYAVPQLLQKSPPIQQCRYYSLESLPASKYSRRENPLCCTP
jgi:hypothetical protein